MKKLKHLTLIPALCYCMCSIAWASPGENSTRSSSFSKDSLPARLLYFSSKKENEKLRFEWGTATEVNSRYFAVERSSDGSNWIAVARLDAAGDNDTLSEYFAYDYTPSKTTGIYRLKQVDWEGRAVYSPIQTVSFYNDRRPFVSPNPARGYLNIDLGAEINAASHIQLFDVTGKLIKQLNSTQRQTRMELAGVNAGVYFIRILRDGKTFSEKIVVE